MNESVIYIVNLVIGVILAATMTPHWRHETTGLSLRYWIAAAWILTVADLLFAVRSGMPSWFRPVPTWTVTLGHAVIVLAAQRGAERRVTPRLLAVVVLAHLAVLVTFYVAGTQYSSWRTVVNGVVWGGLSVAAAITLQRGPTRVRGAMLASAIVLAIQGVFHAVRTWLATSAVVNPTASRSALVQTLGDLEVSLFMVALFVSVLVAHLRLTNADLRNAMKDVRQLAGLLPLCAWCKKVRDDDGYWTQLEQYLEEHRVHVTHGICESCEAKLLASKGTEVAVD